MVSLSHVPHGLCATGHLPHPFRYVSFDPDCPAKGVLAAAAVRMLSKFVANAVYRTPDTLKA